MRRLFWRIFAAFWLVSVAMIITLAWTATSNFETAKIPGLGITRLQRAMDDQLFRTAHELHRIGVDGLRQWLAGEAGYGPGTVYVIDAHGQDLLGREVPPEARAAAADAGAGQPPRPERVRTRELRTRDGHDYIGVAVFEGSFLKRLIYRRPSAFWSNIGIAMLISALVGALLAWYIAAPLARIRASTRRFALGDLDTRVGRLRFGASAEMTSLAREFDHMAERIKALVESHRRLVRDVSHELRSPLARQRVALELARDGDAAQVRDSLDRIERESDRLEAMLAQALELSRLETAPPQRREPVALDALLEDVITNADYEGAPRGRKVLLAERTPLTVSGSRDALYSAFENVIRNALAYTADGSAVCVRLYPDPADAARAQVRVRDHGPGVPEADLARIFEPFYRTDTARNRASGGTGLGLAIARRAIERHAGSILARNAEGGGLEVLISLPALP